MTEKSKEQRLAELLKQARQPTPSELPRERSRMESRDLGEAAGARKCPSVQCDQFAVVHPILVKGTENVSYMVDGRGTISDKIENSTSYWEPVDPADGICPGCGINCGCLPPGSKSILEGTLNPSFGVRTDRDAVLVHRKKQGLPLPKWAEEVAKANLAVQRAVKDDV